MCCHRLADIAGAASGKAEKTGPEALANFVHYTCPSLPHLLALLCRPSAFCIPPSTSLLVVDSLSALLNDAFPKVPDMRSRSKNSSKSACCRLSTPVSWFTLTSPAGPSVATRRLQVVQYIIGALQKLAATRNIAVVVLTPCATKLQAERGATLVPAINTSAWEQGISTRLVLFRDWVWQGDEAVSAHLVGAQKLNGKASDGAIDTVVAFTISSVRPNGPQTTLTNRTCY